MKKLNQKGLSHHLLLVVVAVIGAAGYFVWQKQSNKGIDAKAADYNYQNTVQLGMGSAYNDPAASFLACSKRVGTTNNYTLNTKLVSTTGPTTGLIKTGNKTIQTLKLLGAGTVNGSKSLKGTTLLDFEGTWSVGTRTGLPFIKGSFTLQDLIPCDFSTISKNYNYKLYLGSETLDSSISQRNVAFYACKIASGNQYIINTKLVAQVGYSSFVQLQKINYGDTNYVDLASQNTNSILGTVQYIWPRPVVSANSYLAFFGNYLKNGGTGVKLFGPLGIESPSNIPNCN